MSQDLGSRDVDGEFVWTVEVVAPLDTGDALIAVEGTLGTSDSCSSLRGGASVGVTSAELCPDRSELLEAGSCIEATAGSRLSADGWVHFMQGFRTMAHPRDLAVNGDVVVACNTDSVAMFSLEQLESNQGPLAYPPIPSPLSEAMLSVAEMEGCERLLWDPTRNIVVTGSRGVSFHSEAGITHSGGLVSWRLPESGMVGESIELLDIWSDEAGTAGLAFGPDGLLYVAAKPNRLLVFELSEDGVFIQRSSQTLPEARGVWGLVVEGEHLYLTDAGGVTPQTAERHAPEEGVGDPAGGHLLVFRLDTPWDPSLLGSVELSGQPRGLAVLPEGRVAVACGSAGVALVDVSDPTRIAVVATSPTPGTAVQAAFGAGYVLVADWDSLQLFDVSVLDELHWLGGSDLSSFDYGEWDEDTPAEDFAGWQGLFGSQNVIFDGTTFFATEFRMLIRVDVTPGKRSPRLDLPTRALRLPIPVDGAVLPQHVRNDGQETLLVDVSVGPVPPSGSVGSGSGLRLTQRVVLPGESAALLIPLLEADGKQTQVLSYRSNDPNNPIRVNPMEWLDGVYSAGEETPPFRLPIVNVCDGSGCTTTPECYESLAGQRPVVLAFFSTW